MVLWVELFVVSIVKETVFVLILPVMIIHTHIDMSPLFFAKVNLLNSYPG